MSVTGIIAEFNPLHTGHDYLIKTAKKQGLVICVMSSNFVQRGDTALAEKRVRAEAALRCGADLILELPVCWSMSTAQNFALGGVSILQNIGCDTLMFGSECGEVAMLKKACDILKSDAFKKKITAFLDTGMTFASARENAAMECGLGCDILSAANNNLAIEYMLAADITGSNFNFTTVKRQGAMHDSQTESEKYASASLIRKNMLSGNMDFAKKYLPTEVYDMLTDCNLSDIKNIENAVLAILRTKSRDEIAKLPDLSEGIENKIFSAIRLATNLEELYNIVKVKRYTHARIRRLVLSAAIGIDNSYFMKQPPYVRVLGFNKNGEQYIKRIISAVSFPVILRVGEITNLPPEAQKVFEWECKATDLYALSLKNSQPCGIEYNSKLIKVE